MPNLPYMPDSHLIDAISVRASVHHHLPFAKPGAGVHLHRGASRSRLKRAHHTSQVCLPGCPPCFCFQIHHRVQCPLLSYSLHVPSSGFPLHHLSYFCSSSQHSFPCHPVPCATPTPEFCAPVAARLNVNLEQDVDFCPGLSKFSLKTPKSQDANLAGMLRVRPNVGYGERISASASI